MPAAAAKSKSNGNARLETGRASSNLCALASRPPLTPSCMNAPEEAEAQKHKLHGEVSRMAADSQTLENLRLQKIKQVA